MNGESPETDPETKPEAEPAADPEANPAADPTPQAEGGEGEGAADPAEDPTEDPTEAPEEDPDDVLRDQFEAEDGTTIEVWLCDYAEIYDGEEHMISCSALNEGDVVLYSTDGENYTLEYAPVYQDFDEIIDYDGFKCAVYSTYAKLTRDGKDYYATADVIFLPINVKVTAPYVRKHLGASWDDINDSVLVEGTLLEGDSEDLFYDTIDYVGYDIENETPGVYTTQVYLSEESTWEIPAYYSVTYEDETLTVLESTGHTWKTYGTEATCTEDGHTGIIACEECGATYDKGIVVPAHHTIDYTTIDIVEFPTETEAGYYTYVCSVCGETVSVTLPAYGYDSYSNLYVDSLVVSGGIKDAWLNNREGDYLAEGQEWSDFFTEEEKTAIKNGDEDAVLILSVSPVEYDKDDTSEETAEEFASMLAFCFRMSERVKEAGYIVDVSNADSLVTLFDAYIYTSCTGDEVNIHDDSKVLLSITMQLSDSLINHDSSINRSYRVVNLNEDGYALDDGEVASFDVATGTISFTTWNLGRMALICLDKKVDNSSSNDSSNNGSNDSGSSNTAVTTSVETTTAVEEVSPKTADVNSFAWVAVLALTLSGVGFTILSKKSRRA